MSGVRATALVGALLTLLGCLRPHREEHPHPHVDHLVRDCERRCNPRETCPGGHADSCAEECWQGRELGNWCPVP